MDEITRCAISRAPTAWWSCPIIRADFYGHCASYPDLARPARREPRAGRTDVERRVPLGDRAPGATDRSASGVNPSPKRLVNDVVDEPGGLPLLSTTLVELWNSREDGWLRAEAYERIHGGPWCGCTAGRRRVRGAHRCGRKGLRLGCSYAWSGLGEGEAATRRRVPIAEFDLERSEVDGRGDRPVHARPFAHFR